MEPLFKSHNPYTVFWTIKVGSVGVVTGLMFVVLLLTTLLALPAGAGSAPRVIGKKFTLAASGSTRVRGKVAPGTEDAWSFRINRGKEARVRIVTGAKQVVCDLYDGRSMTANEGVDEGDWFPVSPGPYRLVVNNVTGLGTRSVGRVVTYVISVEVR